MAARVAVLITLLLCAFGSVAAAASHAVRVSVPVRDAVSATYTLSVDGPAAPVIVLLPADAGYARLTRGTVVTERSRNAISALGPLGHALPSFRLDGLHAGERISLQIEPASAGPPRVIGDVDVLEEAQISAAITGIAFGILLVIALWQSTVFWMARDLTVVPFLLATATRAAVEAVRSGLLSAQLFGSPQMTFFVLDVIASAAEIAFVIGYVRVGRQTTQRVIAATTAVLFAALLTVWIDVPLQTIAEPALIIVRLAVAPLLAAVAAWRWRAGFKPAAFVFAAIAVNLASTLYLLILNHTGSLVPPLDPWIFQIGTALPALVLALGIPYRTRFVYSERESLERDLRAAEFAAEHDPLTSLLNRRGLAAWTAPRRLAGGCLLYIDLDGFKRVNDVAGHDAGDRMLMAVGGVLSSAVRAGDAVARVGGDEFVVVLDQRSATRAAVIAEAITGDVEALTVAGSEIRIGASIGRADFSIDASFEQTLAAADADAYRVKAERRSRMQPQG